MTRSGAVALAVLILGACSSGDASESNLPYVPRPIITSGPYVVTAIDYHFHDAHPTEPLGPQQELIVHNDSVHLHNVTIPSVPYSRDVRPGDSLNVGTIGDLFSKPGRYRFYCTYHLDRGMKGVIVVTSA